MISNQEREKLVRWVVEMRHLFHRSPCLSGQEGDTSSRIAQQLRDMGLEVRSCGGAAGILCDIVGGEPGPTILYRADIDALPISEEVDVEWRSENHGVMHACGHDAHIALALGLAKYASSNRATWKGTLRMCFQPSEESASGALPMIEDGALKGVDTVVGVHVWSLLPSGAIGVAPGTLFGSADEFALTIRGHGGHGGLPHLAADPIVAGSAVVAALQSIVSRETAPTTPAVVTIGTFHAGSAFNVIAQTAEMTGTVRATTHGERERLMRRVEEIAHDVAMAYGTTCEWDRRSGCPPVVGDPHVSREVKAAVHRVRGAHVESVDPITVGDDMAYFLQERPGCYFLVGVGPKEGTAISHHHPRFVVDDDGVAVGLDVIIETALGVSQGEAISLAESSVHA